MRYDYQQREATFYTLTSHRVSCDARSITSGIWCTEIENEIESLAVLKKRILVDALPNQNHWKILRLCTLRKDPDLARYINAKQRRLHFRDRFGAILRGKKICKERTKPQGKNLKSSKCKLNRTNKKMLRRRYNGEQWSIKAQWIHDRQNAHTWQCNKTLFQVVLFDINCLFALT